MRQVIAFFLALLILLQPFYQLWTYVAFKLDQDRIIKSLCVKRDMIDNDCQGNCVLMKKLQDAEKAAQNQSPPEKLAKVEMPYCATAGLIDVSPFMCIINGMAYGEYKTGFLPPGTWASVFHPPDCDWI